MDMHDLDLAKKRLNEKKLTLSVAKNGKIIFETTSHGVSGFLDAVEKLKDQLEGASVADKIVGKAIALLCVYAKVRAVYAVIMSKKAEAILEENKVYHKMNSLVENILNTERKGTCPFEKLAENISDAEEAYRKLRELQRSLNIKDERK